VDKPIGFQGIWFISTGLHSCHPGFALTNMDDILHIGRLQIKG